MHHEQDMRKMGGLSRKMPLTYGHDADRHAGADRRRHSRTLIGFAGFYSKDAIIEAAYAAPYADNYAFWLLVDRRVHDRRSIPGA